MKLISVVIPCYNHGVYLEEAVDSVLAQSFDNVEIIIVNDGSTDQYTISLFDSFYRPKCRVLHTENQGLPAARNYGVQHSNGEYICCLDADDTYHPHYFTKAAAIFEQDQQKKYGAVPSWVQMFGNCDRIWKTIGSNTRGFHKYLQGVRNNIQSATMFRRECWEKLGGFDETMILGYEDWDFWLRMLDSGYEWYCLEEPLIYYRQKEESMVIDANEIRTQLFERIIENNSRFYRNNLTPILLEMDIEISRLKSQNATIEEEFRKKNKPFVAILRQIIRSLFCSGE